MFRFAINFVLLVIFCGGPAASAQTKRALLIGIDTYEAHGRPIPKIKTSNPAGPSRFDLLEWPDLAGAVNDVKTMQSLLTSPKFGFPKDPDHMHVILQDQATHDGILAAMRKYLVDEPASGDVVFFYYAGHGSLRYNSKSDKRASHLDNTIVPADAYTGVFDVRDREIARIFNAALDKGVILTAIFDSCHSGTIARGIPLGTPGATRFLAYDPRDINEGPDLKDGKQIVSPEDRPVNAALTFSATQPDQLAREWPNGAEAHGAFTIALLQALMALPADTPAKDVYKRVKVVMEGMGLSDQQPVLDGTASRQQQPLFGKGTGDTKLRVAVAGMGPNGTIVLDAGMASNLGPGTELVQVSEGGQRLKGRLRIQRVNGLTRSDAQMIGPAGTKANVGDIFDVEKWIPMQSNLLKVWIPAALPQAELTDVSNEFLALYNSANIARVDDPANQAPTHMIWWDGQQWILTSAGSAHNIPLGVKPNASTITQLLNGSRIRLFVNFPPSRELVQQLQLGESTNMIQVVKEPEASLYLLVGAMQEGQLQYSWFRRPSLEQAATRTGKATANSACSEDSPYPMRSDWVRARDIPVTAQGLSTLASRLAKLYAWLDLPTPQTEGAGFPYHLALKRVSDGAYAMDTPTREGEEYDLVLRADRAVAASTSPRWIYVLGIDCTGQGTLLFPYTGGGNKFPTEDQRGQEIVLPLGKGHIGIGEPFGIDTYILLITDEQLPDPGVLNFEGAAARGARLGSTPLQNLLGSMSNGTRGAHLAEPTPTNWSVQFLHLRSLSREASAQAGSQKN